MLFEDEFAIADRPMLRQLAHLDEDYTGALFVMVDSRAARIYEVILGELLTEVRGRLRPSSTSGPQPSGRRW